MGKPNFQLRTEMNLIFEPQQKLGQKHGKDMKKSGQRLGKHGSESKK